MTVKVKIIKQKLEFEECLKQRLEFINEFSKVISAFINGTKYKIIGKLQTEKGKNKTRIKRKTMIQDFKRPTIKSQVFLWLVFVATIFYLS